MTIEQIWQDYQHALKGFLHKRLNNTADVDDLLQDILIKTHQNLHQLQSQDSTKSWLFQIAQNSLIDYYRQHRPTTIDAQELADSLASEEQTITLKQDLSQCLMPFLQTLPEKDASLLQAIDLEQQSQKDYAKQQGIAYSTLKSRVQKSRHRLKKLYEDCCHLSLDAQGNVMDYPPKSSCQNG